MGLTNEELLGLGKPKSKGITTEELLGQKKEQEAVDPENMTWGETAADTAAAAGAGIVRGGAALVGLPGDAINAGQWLAWKANRLFDESAPEPDWSAPPVPTSSEMIEGLSDLTGGATDYKGKTLPAQYAGTIGEFATGMLGGGGGKAAKFAKNVLLPAAASETAGQLVQTGNLGDAYEPYARIGGALLGSGVAHVAPKYTAAFTKSGREAAAGDALMHAASDPDAAIAAAKKKALEIIPGSPATLAEATGDIGLAQTTKRTSALSPSMREAQTDLQGQQNAARTKYLSDIAPEGANPMAATEHLQGKVSGISAKAAADEAALKADLQTKLNALPPSQHPEALGEHIRETVASKKAAEREAVADLYNRVDPDNSLVVVTTPVNKKAAEILGEIGDKAKPLEGEEKAIFEIAKSYSPTDKFQSLIDFRKRINDEAARLARAGEGGRSLARLNVLRESVDDAIDNAFNNQQTFKTPAGYKGLQPNMTPGAATRLRKANETFREYAKTYREGPVKGMLASSGYGYKNLNAQMPQMAFKSGPLGGQTVNAFLKAAGKTKDSVDALKNAAIMPLRDAIKGSGAITVDAVDAWKKKYKYALEAISEADPNFVKDVDRAAHANALITESAEAVKKSIDDVTVGKAKALLGATDNDAVKNTVTNAIFSKNGSRDIAEILTSVSGSPEAIAGIKASGVRGIIDRASTAGISGGERALSGPKLRNIVRDNSEAIKALYGQDGLDRFNALAADLERSEIAASNAMVKGGSDTASLLGPFAKQAAAEAGDISLAGILAGVIYNSAAMGNLGLALSAGASATAWKAISALRKSGIAKVNDLYEKALLDPKVGAALMEKAVKNGKLNTPALNAALNAISAVQSSRIRDRYMSGGRVGINHESEAEKLISAAEAARENLGNETSSFLQQPDELIVKALSVANKEI